MKSKKKFTGKCSYCRENFSKSEMAKHLITCEKSDSFKETKTFKILVEGRGMPQYWLIIEAKADAKLKHLDDFLRKIWLECCGHLSAFEIDKKRYNVISDSELGGRTMNFALGKVLAVGTKFYHQYDFGSTTELELKVISEQQGQITGKPIKLLARNNPPQMLCQSCGQAAAQICTECLWSDREGLLCDKCAESHTCENDMFLPVVNSPRVGVCGYTG
jgi:hypothetical protein